MLWTEGVDYSWCRAEGGLFIVWEDVDYSLGCITLRPDVPIKSF